MAAKRKSRPTQKANKGNGSGVHLDPGGVEPGLIAPVEVPGSTHAETGGGQSGGSAGRSSKPSEQGGKPPAPKGGPVPRSGARVGGTGRGHGASQARRYAFRRS